eukprot:TRINITY_DN4608_c0_g1_i1.p1 TRINITY_DN4608_c0_g1~~TRINITY_DN4608_c0_g1_i1.p1  ORF type:complete len:744 (-),score=166.44 TRINITY_DN4608_c0_g1_i1:217-2124(-)
MDVNKDGFITLQEMVKPKHSAWEDFLRFVSTVVISQKKYSLRKNGSLPVDVSKKDNKKSKVDKSGSSEDSTDQSQESIQEQTDDTRIVDDDTMSEENHEMSDSDDESEEIKSIKRSSDEKSAKESKTTDSVNSSSSSSKKLVKQNRETNLKDKEEYQEADIFDDMEDELWGNGKHINEEAYDAVLTINTISEQQKRIVENVSRTLEISPSLARHLLAELDWDEIKVINEYLDNPEKITQETGIKLPTFEDDDDVPPTPKKKSNDPPYEIVKQMDECLTCMDDTDDFIQLTSCGHKMCRGCWRGHIETKISEGHTYDIGCASFGCTEYVPIEFIQYVVPDDVWKKYVEFLSNTYVERGKHAKWCKGDNCGRAIELSHEGKFIVGKCTCGMVFCWKCDRQAHHPCTCSQAEEWLGQFSADLLNSSWIYENTKQCPKCKSRVEKQGGCFQMSCRCGYQFCWLCLMNYRTHYSHFRCATFPLAGSPDNVGNKVSAIGSQRWREDRRSKIGQRFNEIETTEKDALRIKKNIDYAVDKLKSEALLFDESPIIQAREVLQFARRLAKWLVVKRIMDSNRAKRQKAKHYQLLIESSITKLADKYEKTLPSMQPQSYNFEFTKDIKNLTSDTLSVANEIVNSRW